MRLTCSNDTNIIRPRKNDAPSKVKLMIQHQCFGTELVSPLHYSNGATCYLSPNQRVVVGSIMEAGFNTNLNRKKSTGALMYRLEREYTNQPNKKTISDEDEAMYTQLFIVWEIDSYKEFWVALDLIKHDKSHVWNRDGLMELARRCKLFNVYGLLERAWSMYDNKALMANLLVTREEEYYKLNMTIYEGSVEDNVRRPLYIDMNR
jgi:hypothetical protein